MIDRLEQDLSPLRSAINLRARRQELLASNIANADTPYYQARDLDFAAAFAAARGSAGNDAATLARTQPGHLAGAAITPHDAALRYRTEYQGAIDGNTVDMDVERAAFASNALELEALITFVSQRLRTMTMAIQGQ